MTSPWDYITSSVYHIVSWGPFYWHVLILIPAWKSNNIHYEVLDEITYPLLNFNAVILEFWEWISNFTPHLTGPMISSNKLADHTSDHTNPGKWGACFSGNWVATSMCTYQSLPRGHQATEENLEWKRFQLNQYLSRRSHSSFKPTWVFEDFVFVLQMTHSKYSRDKANMGNPKINRGCPLLTGNRTSADCVWITSGPSVQHIPLWVYHTLEIKQTWVIPK